MTERQKIEIRDPVLIDAPMPIVTPRLVLRPLQTGDGAAMNEAKQETWGSLSKVFAWASKGCPDAETDEIYVRKKFADYILRRDFALVGETKDDECPVIWTGLHHYDWDLRNFQIGFWVRESAQRQGYASEAANALIRYAFDQLQVTRMTMCHTDGNEASRKIITGLGFEHEGARKSGIVVAGGTIKDAHYYGLLSTEKLPTLDVSW